MVAVGLLREGVKVTAERLEPYLRRGLAAARRWTSAASAAVADAAVGTARAIADAAGRARRRSRAAVDAAAEAVRPEQVALTVAGLGAAMLALAQFLDYHAVEVITVERGRANAGAAHLYLLLPAAAWAAWSLRAAWIERSPRPAGQAALIGVAAILVSLVVDLPQGLSDDGLAAIYAGATGTLIEGFYLQLGAGATLAVTGALLAAHLRGEQP